MVFSEMCPTVAHPRSTFRQDALAEIFRIAFKSRSAAQGQLSLKLKWLARNTQIL
jgi:hypothetical protein